MLDAHPEGWHGLKRGLQLMPLFLKKKERKIEDLVLACPEVLAYINFILIERSFNQLCNYLNGYHST
jgi:hypothetical protein